MLSTDNIRAILSRLRLKLSRQGRQWVLTDNAGSTPQLFKNLGELAAFVIRCGGSCTVRLSDNDREALRTVAVARGVPTRP